MSAMWNYLWYVILEPAIHVTLAVVLAMILFHVFMEKPLKEWKARRDAKGTDMKLTDTAAMRAIRDAEVDFEMRKRQIEMLRGPAPQVSDHPAKGVAKPKVPPARIPDETGERYVGHNLD